MEGSCGGQCVSHGVHKPAVERGQMIGGVAGAKVVADDVVEVDAASAGV
jgi:hypothetical protein